LAVAAAVACLPFWLALAVEIVAAASHRLCGVIAAVLWFFTVWHLVGLLSR
jgi:hypothetical protein